MAGFLNALSFTIPVAQSIGPALQIGARERERQDAEDAYRNMLDQELPNDPSFNAIRQYSKVASPHDTAAVLGGDLGKNAYEKYQLARANQIWNQKKPDGSEYTEPEKLQNLAVAGIIPWDKYLEFIKQPTKAPAPTIAGMQSNISNWYASHGRELNAGDRAWVESALSPNASYEQVKSVNDKLVGPYEGASQYATRSWNQKLRDEYGRTFTGHYVEPTHGGGPARLQSVAPGWSGPESGYQDTSGQEGEEGEDEGGEEGGGAPAGGGYGGAPGAGAGPGPGAGGGGAGPGAAANLPSSVPTTVAPPQQYASGYGAPRGRGRGGAPAMFQAPLGQTEQRAVDSIQTLLPAIERNRRHLEAVGEETWNRDVASRFFGKMLAAELDILPGSSPAEVGAQVKTLIELSPEFNSLKMQNRDLAYTTSEIITNEAMSVMALLQMAGVRSGEFADKYKGHIEQALGNYNSIMINMASIKAQYLEHLRALGVKPLPPEPEPKQSREAAPRDIDKEDDDFINQFKRKKQ